MIDLKQRADRNTGTTGVREGFELDERQLQDWMEEHVEAFHPPIVDVQQFKGGQSNPTYKISTAKHEYVLRSKPRGSLLKTAHAIDREYRVMSALGNTDVPTPRTYALCKDETILGVCFYIMDFTPGVVVWDLPTDRWEKADRNKIWKAGAEAATRLHCASIEDTGLDDFGKQGGYVARQLKRWGDQYEYTKDGVDNPSLGKLINWLPQYLPDDEPTTIVHGDLQLSNMILSPDFDHCRAIIDWELSTLGNPLSDFAYYCRDYHVPIEDGGFAGVPERFGLPSEAEILSAYCDRTGLKLGDDWLFYIVFNMFRLAAIRQGVAKRILDGTATSPDAETAAKGAVLMADNAWRIVQSNF